MGTLLCSCVKVCDTIVQPFGLVSGVGPGFGVLDGAFGFFLVNRFESVFFSLSVREKCVRLVREKSDLE